MLDEPEVDVPAGIAEVLHRQDDDRRQPEVPAEPVGHDADDTDGQVAHRVLPLESTVAPGVADQLGRLRPVEDVEARGHHRCHADHPHHPPHQVHVDRLPVPVPVADDEAADQSDDDRDDRAHRAVLPTSPGRRRIRPNP